MEKWDTSYLDKPDPWLPQPDPWLPQSKNGNGRDMELTQLAFPSDSNAPPAYTSLDPTPPRANPSLYPPTVGTPRSQNYSRDMSGRDSPPAYFQPGPQAVYDPPPQPERRPQQRERETTEYYRDESRCNCDCDYCDCECLSDGTVYILSCIVIWFCGMFCGLIAYWLAILGHRKTSVCFSILGIITGVGIIAGSVCLYIYRGPRGCGYNAYYGYYPC